MEIHCGGISESKGMVKEKPARFHEQKQKPTSVEPHTELLFGGSKMDLLSRSSGPVKGQLPITTRGSRPARQGHSPR